MNKMVYALNVDGYAPEITELTYPWLRHYASKSGHRSCPAVAQTVFSGSDTWLRIIPRLCAWRG